MRQSFYFYANPYQPQSAAAARALAGCLAGRGARIYAQAWLADQGVGTAAEMGDKDVRALVAFGGDGTLLRAAPEAARLGTPLLGVHTGHVGFLMGADPARPADTAEALLRPVYDLETHPMLEVSFAGRRDLALNDVSITRGEHPGVIEVGVEADGERVFSPHGDGVVVSTPLGATAYALAAGGPIVRPDTPCLIVAPLCARELLQRPVVLPDRARITLIAHGQARRRLQLAIDGQTLFPIDEEARVDIYLARERASLIVLRHHRFFGTLRQKQAAWNQQEEQE